jgi:hypothetical protein
MMAGNCKRFMFLRKLKKKNPCREKAGASL